MTTEAPSKPPSFTCPKCGRTSYHPQDIEHGYCGFCRAFTGTVEQGYSSDVATVDRVTLYNAADGVRWRYQAAGNAEVLADSGQGYSDGRHAMLMAQRVVGRTLTTNMTEFKAHPLGTYLVLVDRTDEPYEGAAL